MSDDRRPGLILRLLQSWLWDEPMHMKHRSSVAIPWIIRAGLLIVSWRGISSESEWVSGIALFLFVSLVLSLPSLRVFGGKANPAVLIEGDTKVVLHEATWPHWFATERVLHDDFNIPHSQIIDMLKSLPLTLEPPVVRSQAEDLVTKLKKAGAVASVVTTNLTDTYPRLP